MADFAAATGYRRLLWGTVYIENFFSVITLQFHYAVASNRPSAKPQEVRDSKWVLPALNQQQAVRITAFLCESLLCVVDLSILYTAFTASL
ncbi:MAG: hypothetical protein E7056_02415 [Lentisphaerae bacterium]|nr:hypothetical protein [Lentisphaerota bacterium]